jgi:predicted phage baseplate assembly protein
MVWWRSYGRAAEPNAQPAEEFPALIDGSSRTIRAAVAGRIASYTPDWTPGSGADAGVALVKAFSEQAAPVFAQANRLRDKFRYEELRIAGVVGRGASLANVMIVFSLLETAPESVLIPEGTQLMVPGAEGPDQVVFETSHSIHATAAMPSVYVLESGTRTVRLQAGEITPDTPQLIFGSLPRPGDALWFGFTGPLPYPRLALGIELIVPDEPSLGVGVAGTRPGGDPPVLSWELLTPNGLAPIDVQADGTGGLRQRGIIEIGTRRDWAPLQHPLLPSPEQLLSPPPKLRWLRLSLLHGRYEVAPMLAGIRPNAVMAAGAETVRSEILESVDDLTRTQTRRFRLSRTPVLPGTVRIAVDAPGPGDLFDLVPADSGRGHQLIWTEVPSLALSKPYDRHFVLDEASGILTFGDGIRGAPVPPGFRHVEALSYRTGGGKATAVRSAAGFVPRGTIPFVTAVENPYPASGGADAEELGRLVARGPDALRTRQRVVTAPDAETLAAAAPAGVGRVVAIAGQDTDGILRPGQMTLVVLSDLRDGLPPVPARQSLEAVENYFAGSDRPLAALGARIVVRPAHFVLVELEIAVVIDGRVDRSQVVLGLVRAANSYLDPLTGGNSGQGWPLGAPVTYRRLVAAIAAAEGVQSVRRIGVMVAGRISPPCRDAELPSFALPWPGNHIVLPESGE